MEHVKPDREHKTWSPVCYMHICTFTPQILDQQAGVGQTRPQKIPSNVGRQKKITQPNRSCTHPGATRRRFPAYLVGRLTTMKTQRNSFTGREGFAIAAEAKFDGAIIIITIFPSSSVPMDASVYSLGSPSPRCITHASGSGSANLDPTQTYGGAG